MRRAGPKKPVRRPKDDLFPTFRRGRGRLVKTDIALLGRPIWACFVPTRHRSRDARFGARVRGGWSVTTSFCIATSAGWRAHEGHPWLPRPMNPIFPGCHPPSPCPCVSWSLALSWASNYLPSPRRHRGPRPWATPGHRRRHARKISLSCSRCQARFVHAHCGYADFSSSVRPSACQHGDGV